MTQDKFTIEALRRLPVAASLLAVSAIICSEERMAKIFSEHRGRSCEYILSFHGVATVDLSLSSTPM